MTTTKRIVFLAAVVTVSFSSAAPKPRIQIQVIRVDVVEAQELRYIPGKAGKTNTACDTGLPNPYSTAPPSSVTCNTTSTPGTPASADTVTVQRSLVRIIFPDGTKDGKHVTLACRAGGGALAGALIGASGGTPSAIPRERCRIPDAGASYDVEVSGNNVTVFSRNLEGKEQKDTFTSAGTWTDAAK